MFFSSVSEEYQRPGRTINFLKALGRVGDETRRQLYVFGYFFFPSCVCVHVCMGVYMCVGPDMGVNKDMSMHMKGCGCEQVQSLIMLYLSY